MPISTAALITIPRFAFFAMPIVSRVEMAGFMLRALRPQRCHFAATLFRASHLALLLTAAFFFAADLLIAFAVVLLTQLSLFAHFPFLHVLTLAFLCLPASV